MGDSKRERPIVLLLFGQLYFFSIALSLIQIAGSAVFLARFGAERLPFVFIAIAFFVSGYSAIYVRLQQRFSLSQLSTATMLIFCALLFGSAIGLARPGGSWIAFVLMIAFTLGYQMVFIIIGGQAGTLFNVRQMKRLFPTIASGMTLGFLTGGLLLPLLRLVLPRTEQLLFAGVISMLLAAILLRITTRRYSAELLTSTPPPTSTNNAPTANTPTLWQLLKKRFVSQLFIYQMLSAIGTQLVFFIFLDRAEATYGDVESLASFFGNFAIIMNVLLLLFLARPASYILSRFGLGVGLLANPVVVGLLILSMTVVGMSPIAAAPALFLLAAAARIADTALSVGTTNPSIKSGYQALPDSERAIVETTVEGIGVPLAFGVAGVLLLVFNAIPQLTNSHLILLTAFVSILWLAASYFVYRGYRQSLRQKLQPQELAPVQLNLDDSATLATVVQQLESDDAAEVKLGLDALSGNDHPSLDAHLMTLLEKTKGEPLVDLLNRVAERRLWRASSRVRQLMTSDSATVTAAAIRAWSALHESAVNHDVMPYLEHDNPNIKRAALVGLLRYGGMDGMAIALERMQGMRDSAEKQLLAQVIGESGTSSFYQSLIALLQDEDQDVRLAALESARLLKHPRLIESLIDNLSNPATRPAAISALERSGTDLLPHLKRALIDPEQIGYANVERLIRIAGQQHDEKLFALLFQHIDHPGLRLRGQVLHALSNMARQTTTAVASEPVLQRLDHEVQHAQKLLLAITDYEIDAASNLHLALQDELTQTRQRAFDLVALVGDGKAVLQAATQLNSKIAATRALALEVLDVSMTAHVKQRLFPLIDPSLTTAQRISQLAAEFPIEALTQGQRLDEMAANADERYLVWTQAYAIYEIGRNQQHALRSTVDKALEHTNPIVSKAAQWSSQTLQSKL